MRERVLVVEDDDAIRELVTFHLARAGYDVRDVASGAAALGEVEAWRPEAVVLDLLLPDVSGLDLCNELRARGAALDWPGVIMLTALTDEGDRIAGLEMGADDYVSKPFSPRELVARVRAVLRRRQKPGVAGEPEESGGAPMRVGDLEIDRARFRVSVAGTPVEGFTATEFRLLATLAGAAGRVLSREQLIEHVWGPDFFGDERTVDVHIRHIREKLSRAGAAELIETVRGVGYRLAIGEG